jgi:uncharacterized repeat protein (TIGR01451 family)
MIQLLLAAVMLATLSPHEARALTPAGTEIKNTASATYEDTNTNSYTATSNEVTVTVSEVYATALTCSGDQSAPSNTTVYYACTVTNNGNTSDTFGLNASSAPVWATVLYADDGAGGGTANDGIHQAGETTVTASSGALLANGTYRFFVAVTVPTGTANGVTSTYTLNVNGTDGGAADDASDTGITTAQAPAVTIEKKVRNFTTAPGGAFADSGVTAKPTEVLQYQLKVVNNGAIDATKLVLSDTLDGNLTYVAGSLWSGDSGTTHDGGTNINNTDGNTGETCAANVCATATRAGQVVTFRVGNGANETAGGSFPSGGTTIYLYYRATVN